MGKKPLHPIKAASEVSQCLIRAAEVMVRQGRTPDEAAEFAEAAAKVLELPPEWVRLTAAIVRGIDKGESGEVAGPVTPDGVIATGVVADMEGEV